MALTVRPGSPLVPPSIRAYGKERSYRGTLAVNWGESAAASASVMLLPFARSPFSCGGGSGCNVAIAFRASAVVKPRLPILPPEVGNLYTQLASHPPSSHCSGSNASRSRPMRKPTAAPARTRMDRASASPGQPARSTTRARKSGASRECSAASCVLRRRRAEKKRKHSAVS